MRRLHTGTFWNNSSSGDGDGDGGAKDDDDDASVCKQHLCWN